MYYEDKTSKIVPARYRSSISTYIQIDCKVSQNYEAHGAFEYRKATISSSSEPPSYREESASFINFTRRI